MAKEYKDLIVGLDIGTAKVMVVVGEVMPGGELRLAGLGVAPSHGLKRGVVVNIDATVNSIQQALKEAELMADCKITRVYTGITGSHIRGLNSSGMVAVKDKEVTAADVARVIETAKAINISTDQRLLLVEPQEFVIDGQDVKEPIGMSGIRLEAKVHIVTGAQSAAENIIKCVRRCGLDVDQLMLNPLASSLAVLTEDERELGVACVDIGAGCTDVAIFTNGAIRHTAVIPIAGDLITSDDMSPTPLAWPTMLPNVRRLVPSMPRHQRGLVARLMRLASVGLGGDDRPFLMSLWRWPRICRSSVSCSAEHPAALARSIRRSM